jgi:serine/threonine-protein kinase HipA
MNVARCPSTLKSGFTTYSPAALRVLFARHKVNHVLPFMPPQKDDAVRELFMENRKRLSISGVQTKLSLRLEKNKLRLCEAGEHGHYILKPIPDDVRNPEHVPANEHLTMQLAEKVFDIATAPNALIFFKDGEHAYLTKRFDVKNDNTKFGVEDFASLAQRTRENAGLDFKYEGSYEYLFVLLKKFVGPYAVESRKLFRLMLFNYAVANGDAHLKNFSLIETNQGDYVLSPAYDLLCTRLHVNDSDLALKDGLFADDYETEYYKANAFYGAPDFLELGKRVGLPESFVLSELKSMHERHYLVEALIEKSFLPDEMKYRYKNEVNGRLSRLKILG